MKAPFHQLRANWVSKVDQADNTGVSSDSEEQDVPTDLFAFLPCVLYECNSAFQITRISSNASEIIRIRPEDLIGTRAFWEERVLREDSAALTEKLNELETSGSASVIHRIIDNRGLPVWVAHTVRRVTDQNEVIRGCIIPISGEKRVQDLDRGVISRFVHKIGNQFQLLNLVINSLRKVLPESRETELLQQTVEKAIELTR
jgi:hypothetical protein